MAETALEGLYIIRTSVPVEEMATERAFRSLKSSDLQVGPIYHRLEDRVKAHVFLCMLAYYVEWHMR